MNREEAQELKNISIQNFYDVSSCLDDNLEAVAILIQLQSLEYSSKILTELKNLRVSKFNKQLEAILDMKYSTLKEIGQVTSKLKGVNDGC